MFMRYIGGAVGHQDVREVEMHGAEPDEMEIVDQDVGCDEEGSNSKRDLSNEEESSDGDDGDDSDDKDIKDWDPDGDNGSSIDDDYDEF